MPAAHPHSNPSKASCGEETLFSLVRFQELVEFHLIIFLLIQLFKPALKDGISFSQAVYDRNGKLLRLTLS